MGNFLMFSLLAGLLVGVKYKSDRRAATLHHGSWLIKVALWLAFSALPFFLPNGVVNAYAWVARFGSPLFLIIQMVILLDMTQSWNDAWVAAGDEDPRWLYALLGATLAAYAGCFTVLGLLYHWFAPGGQDCSFNITVITLALLLCVAITLVTLHPVVRRQWQSLAAPAAGGGGEEWVG